MRFFLFLIITLLFSSCGKNPRTIKTDGNKRPCVFNLLTNRCDPIQGNETSGVEILETVIEVPIKIQGEEIIFLENKSSFVIGKKINCELNVSKGEVYRFSINGNKLLIISQLGSNEFENQTAGENLVGHWVSKAYLDNGVLEIMQLYFLGKNKLILRKTCEL